MIVVIIISSLAIGGFVGTSQDTFLGCAAGLFSFMTLAQLEDIIRKLKK